MADVYLLYEIFFVATNYRLDFIRMPPEARSQMTKVIEQFEEGLFRSAISQVQCMYMHIYLSSLCVCIPARARSLARSPALQLILLCNEIVYMHI